MPATSGSPTQIATSQPTKAALSNTPADQFQSGDLGYVQEELTAGNCPLYALVSTGGPVVDGTMVLSVYQNANARWVSLTVLGLPLGRLGPFLTWSLTPDKKTLQLTSTTQAEVLVVDGPAGTPVDLQTWRVGGVVVGDITATGAIEIKAISFQQNLTGPNLGGGNGVIAEAFGGSLQIASGNQSNGNIVMTAYDAGAIHGEIYLQVGAGAPTVCLWTATQTALKNNYRLGWSTSAGGGGGGATQPILWLSAADEVILGGGLAATGGRLMTAGAGTTCLQWGVGGTTIGFLGAPPVVRPTVSGSRASGAALVSLLAALVSLGLITDSTVA